MSWHVSLFLLVVLATYGPYGLAVLVHVPLSMHFAIIMPSGKLSLLLSCG